jgi:hypothetical protein
VNPPPLSSHTPVLQSVEASTAAQAVIDAPAKAASAVLATLQPAAQLARSFLTKVTSLGADTSPVSDVTSSPMMGGVPDNSGLLGNLNLGGLSPSSGSAMPLVLIGLGLVLVWVMLRRRR